MQEDVVAGTPGGRIWALLVGIDTYLSNTVAPLRGCINDVAAMRILLQTRYGVPDTQIRMLRGPEATRTAMLQAFADFLIQNAQIGYGDQIVFHYSGHGSQMRVGPHEYEPDGLNETIVPYDSRTPGVYDIPDKTLATLLDQLAAAKGDQLTVILDCCHAGSGTRQVWAPGATGVRRIPADLRLPPADLDGLLRSGGTRGRATSASGGWRATLPYVLLAGCQDREEAYEYESTVDTDSSGTQGVWHGAFTFFLLREWQQLPADATYAELYDRVAPLVNGQFRAQLPQCEGQRDRMIFAAAAVQRDQLIAVQPGVAGDGIRLGAGLVHGLRPGTQVAVYGPEVRRLLSGAPPLALARVTTVSATIATAVWESPPVATLPSGARAVITGLVYSGGQQTVRLESRAGTTGPESAALAQLRTLLTPTATTPGSPYLRLLTDSDQTADLQVTVTGDEFAIYDAAGTLLVDPLAGPQAVAQTCQALESIVRYRAILDLRNEDPQSRLTGRVTLRLRRFVGDSTGPRAEELPAEATGAGGACVLYYDEQDDSQNKYVVDIINQAPIPVYPHIFTVSPDYSIYQLYPVAGIQEAVQPTTPATPYPVGLQRGTDQLNIYLPPGWDASRDYLKMLVTTRPADLRMLEQPPLQVPPPPGGIRGNGLDALLAQITAGRDSRHARPTGAPTNEDWASTQLVWTTRRRRPAQQLTAPAGQIPLDDDWTLIKPAGFTGEVAVTTLGLARRRAASQGASNPPPGLEYFPEIATPITRRGTRSVGSSQLVIELTTDADSRPAISPTNPLRLKGTNTQDVTDSAEVIPIIFDGQAYWLAGYQAAENGTVDIVFLPLPVTPEGSARREVARTVRLFLYKKTGRFSPELGLHKADLQETGVVYAPIDRTMLAAGQRVAVLVHGFNGDSRWMVQHILPLLQQSERPYDHLLTWDYESYGTSVRENGALLAEALRQQCGCGADDGLTVEVFAHSMGCLVSRCMIELAGGHTFVDRAVLAGPPNRGSTLATLSRGFVYLTTALLNRVSLVPFVGSVGTPIRYMYDQGLGTIDITVNSPITQELNGLGSPINVPYLVLAGEYQPDVVEANRLRRFAERILDRGMDGIFGEENDLAIGRSSMWGLRGATYPRGGGSYPRLTIQALACDHSGYFSLPAGQAAILAWLGS